MTGSDNKWLSPNIEEEGLFSVIVPTYNREDTILETLHSVREQGYRPIEIVIIDDGSRDNTRTLINNWIEKNVSNRDFRCSYEYQENAGVCAARNRGLQKAHGQFIQFLDSDDLLHPERLEKLAQVFKEKQCDYIETGFEGFTSANDAVVSTHLGHVDKNQLQLLLLGKLWPNTLRPAYTRELIKRIGPWNENMKTFQDYEYVIRALTLDPPPKSVAIKDVLARARRDSNDRMSNIIFTKEGRKLRIHCERLLCEAIKDRKDIPQEWKSQLASRIYALGFRSNASGWSDLGKECGAIADAMNVKLDGLGKRRRLVWKSGRLGGIAYNALAKLKSSKYVA